MHYEVIPTKIFRAGTNETAGTLTYSSEVSLSPGHIVKIPLGRSKTVGIVLKPVKKPAFPTKPIETVIYDTPLPGHLLTALLWLSDYYLCPLPTVANLFLPTGVDKHRRPPISTPGGDLEAQTGKPHFSKAYSPAISKMYIPDASEASQYMTSSKSTGDSKNEVASLPLQIPLNNAQHQALRRLHDAQTATKLLHGITGSGKTNIYLELTREALEAKKSVILLVPEIALTSQLVQIFETTFGQTEQILLLHSKQTESQRHIIWQTALNSEKPNIIIGPRSALFAPVKDLGLIIIDEAHEQAYFQESPPKYSALKLASQIASTLKIDCIQGTATPNVTDYYLASHKNAVITLSQKAKTTAKPPNIHLIDLKNRQNFTKNRYFSDQLLEKIDENLKTGHQTLIFHNRRGSAPLTICENCGWQALCPTCYLPLTLHSDAYELLCHTCGYHTPVPKKCPSCGHPDVIHKGFGTKLLEQELKKLKTSAKTGIKIAPIDIKSTKTGLQTAETPVKIARFDADNTKTTSLDALYDQVKDGSIDIIIGTQTIAKGLDLPNLKTVGVVQADAGLSLPDFAAAERTFHLLTQVLGRIGRGHLENTEAYVQTYQPDHPVITSALAADYDSFYAYALKTRRKAGFPPYKYLARLSLTYKTEQTVLKYLKTYHQLLRRNPNISVSIPTPAFHEQSPRGYTWQLTLKSTSRTALKAAVANLPPNPHLHPTLDPPSLL